MSICVRLETYKGTNDLHTKGWK